ncbi:MAG: hypothetical protein AAFW69_12760, partial [Pseudomonadota bacterium]
MFRGVLVALLLGALVGYLSERFGITKLGTVLALIAGVGGAVLLSFLTGLFGFGIGGRTLTAFVGAAADPEAEKPGQEAQQHGPPDPGNEREN